MPRLFTIGYEKTKPDTMLDELKRAKVKILIDVRAVAASRRPGFSKRQLAAALDERGISYVHLQKLGTPAAGRSANHAGDMKKFWRIYEMHLETASAKEEMEKLVALVKSEGQFVLCTSAMWSAVTANASAKTCTSERGGISPILPYRYFDYSAGCTVRRSRSTPLTNTAIKAVPITNPSATIAVTVNTKSNPPRP